LASVQTSRGSLAQIPIVGIVGGVGAGKSSVVQHVKSFRLFVIDADRIGHRQLQVSDILDQIVEAFGSQVLDSTGRIDRPSLAAVVFGDSLESTRRRTQLNEIMHPAIREEILRQIQSAPQDAEIIILDAALLLEAGWADVCEAIIFVDTPLAIRQERVAVTRGWSVEELERREASQWSLHRKRECSHYVVDNSGTPQNAAVQMEKILHAIVGKRTVLQRPD
jgi:dephospho-CoA kinase